MPARTAPADSGDSFALSAAPPVAPTVAPAAPVTGASMDFAAGMQAAQAQSAIVIDSLSAMLAETRHQLTAAQTRIRDDRDDHQKALGRQETEYRTRLDEMRDKLADARDAAADAKQSLAIETIRAEVAAKSDSTMAERVIEPLLGSLPGVMAALGQQHVAPPVYVAPAPAAHAAPDAAPAPPPAAPAEDPAAVAASLLSRFEAGVLSAVTDAIRAQAGGGDASGGSTAVTQGLKVLSRAGITPPTGLFARVALNSVFNALQEAQPAQAVADALRPVVAVAGAAGQFLNTLSPEMAADMLGSLAGVTVPPELKAFLVEVVGLVASGDSAAAGSAADSAPLDAGEIPSTQA